MSAIRTQHSRIFEQLLSARRDALVEALVAGIPGDHAAYRELVGRIHGIADALKISEEADFKLNGDEPDVSGA